MREAVAVELVGDERAEHDEARRIGPKLLAQQADDERDLHQAVAEQVESEEIVLLDREAWRELKVWQSGRCFRSASSS